MLSPDETGYDVSGSMRRASRAASRREILRHKRTRNTDILPGIDEDDALGKASRTVAHLREENHQLRRELTEVQEQLSAYQSSMDVLDREIENIHRNHSQEIEQYQQHLREMMEERNQMQEEYQRLGQQYQDLNRSFQDAVEDEAKKMVKEASQTLILAPAHTPALLSDVVKTLETRMKQAEDQHTTELLTITHQALYKAEQLEEETAQERHGLANEREGLLLLRENMQQQAVQRYKAEEARQRSRWTFGLTFTAMLMLCLMVALESVLENFHWTHAISVFLALAICLLLTIVVARLHVSGRVRLKMASGKKSSAPKKG